MEDTDGINIAVGIPGGKKKDEPVLFGLITHHYIYWSNFIVTLL